MIRRKTTEIAVVGFLGLGLSQVGEPVVRDLGRELRAIAFSLLAYSWGREYLMYSWLGRKLGLREDLKVEEDEQDKGDELETFVLPLRRKIAG